MGEVARDAVARRSGWRLYFWNRAVTHSVIALRALTARPSRVSREVGMANEIARRLRKTMTPQEVKLWAHLRPLRHSGHKFRRQVPLRGYIVDFACFDARLIIELDGSQHGSVEGRAADQVRDTALERGGFDILRFWNV